MKKPNDAVTYVLPGKELREVPAIVFDSRVSDKGELLSLVYLDPDSGLLQLKTLGTVSMAFSVAPGGWKELQILVNDQSLAENLQLKANAAILQKLLDDSAQEIMRLAAEVETLKPPAVFGGEQPTGHPTATGANLHPEAPDAPTA